MKHLDAMDRKTSFNPEAAAFSPTTASIKLAERSTAATGSKISILPRRMFHNSIKAKFIEFETEDSPVRSDKSMLKNHLEKANAALQQVTVEDLLTQGISMDLLMRAFGEISNKSTQGFTSLSPHENVIPQQPIVFPAPSMVPLMFSSQYTEPNLNTVDIDELSASLGLPSAKKETTLNASPACSNNSDASQGVPKALYGKLIDRALSTPLTAHTLAHYMKSRSDSSEETVKAIQGPHDAFATAKTLNQEHGQALKVVRPPPGFANQIPRMVVVENEHPHMPTGPAAMQQKVALAAPSGYFQQHPNMVQSATPLQHHARHNSNRRRPRTHTRTKRTDQGPEPSAADIYPDDAHWTPTQYTQQNYFAPRQYVPPPPQLVVRTGDASSWPTPAEVYTHEPQAPPAAHVPQAFDIFEAHTMPTAGDLGAADSEVLSLIEELPAPTIQTLMHFGAVDLLPEDRSLSPDQQSGKRYGVNFYGIGIGDDWQPPPVQESDPFRVRPRDHSGWGGWEWAIKKGWADA